MPDFTTTTTTTTSTSSSYINATVGNSSVGVDVDVDDREQSNNNNNNNNKSHCQSLDDNNASRDGILLPVDTTSNTTGSTTTTTTTNNNTRNTSVTNHHHDNFNTTIDLPNDDDDDENVVTTTTNLSDTTMTSMKYSDIEYAIVSYYTVVQPVFCTMLLSALAVVYISTPELTSATEEALAQTYYVVHSNPNTDNNSTQLGNSVINSIVIVAVICTITFLIVLLYKYNCIKCLTAYIVISIGSLLGFLATIMFQVFIERYNIYIDKISFTLIMYNFAIVGVLAIFLGTPDSRIPIIPVYINQMYLILTSVIVAWQLSNFDAWTAWVLLVALALYDLFAVLTPCGPLKALVQLMQRENAPQMPGLLYEASLSSQQHNNNNNNNNNNRNRRRRQQQQQQQEGSNSRTADSTTDNNDTIITSSSNHHQSDQILYTGDTTTAAVSTTTTTTTLHDASNNPTVSEEETSILNGSHMGNTTTTAVAATIMYDVDTGEPSTLLYDNGTTTTTGSLLRANGNHEAVEMTPLIQYNNFNNNNNNNNNNNYASIPFALAKLYKLPFRSNPQPPWIRSTTAPTTNEESNDNNNDNDSIIYTPEQLCAMVHVIFPNGGTIVPTVSLSTPVAELYRQTQDTDRDMIRYTVIDVHGNYKRVLFVNDEGRVFEDLREERRKEDRRNEQHVRNSIKLGLGDFIFYSILVSKAALYSYTTFVVCTLAVLSGLGITLLLLAMYGHALPALPVSIFLGVIYYVLTRYVIEPWIETIFISRVYV